MKKILLSFSFALLLLAACKKENTANSETSLTASNDGLDRTVLPIKEPDAPEYDELDARNAKPPKAFKVEAPKNAPNVLVILIDDMGFGMPSVFGGPVHMPTAEKLASEGLRYNRFHTTGLCSPSRIALLTGRNHHSNNMGTIAETATAFPGNTGLRPQNITPLAEILKLNGYSTAQFGKCHETAPWEISESGPFDRWPTGAGFEKFYGFMGAETNQWYPGLFDGTTRIDPPNDPNYHLMPDLANHAIDWMKAQKALTPDKPFFVYFAPGATHTPHHVPKEWIEKYKGKFDMGWDKMRELTLERQKKLGVVPQNTKLAAKHPDIRDWNKLSDMEKKVYSRQMEIYAAFGEYADYYIGKVYESLEEMGIADNTIVYYILGDNGDSPEGGLGGGSELAFLNGAPTTVQEYYNDLDKQGSPYSVPHYSAAWAVAGDAPFAWTKEIAANFGGTRNGMIVRWPKGIKEKGGLRSQFTHMIDIAPTILEASGLPQPKTVNGITEHPIEGVSMVYSFNDAKAKEKHTTQYFELTGSRAIYHDGWVAGALHKVPWRYDKPVALNQDKWELYNTIDDFSESTDLAAKYPEKLKELQDLFMSEAKKYHVLPIDDRSFERLNAKLAGRPDLMAGRTSLTLYNGTPGMVENAFINVKNTSFTITANLDKSNNSNGVIICQGGRFGGWSLYMKGGKPIFHYNWLGKERFTVVSKEAVSSGNAVIKLKFDYSGDGIGKSAIASIYINDKQVAQGNISKTHAVIFCTDETADVGRDDATPVTEDYKAWDNKFTGQLKKVTIDLQQKNKTVAYNSRK